MMLGMLISMLMPMSMLKIGIGRSLLTFLSATLVKVCYFIENVLEHRFTCAMVASLMLQVDFLYT